MPFIVLSGIITFILATSAAYFSIYGLALIFAGAFWPVVIMGAALEAGKLSLTSIVYNYWNDITHIMRGYSIVAILTLMVITSGGIYGFLSAAYQTDQLPLEQITEKIKLLDREFERKNARLVQMDNTIASIASNYISKRLEEKAQQSPERKILSARINIIEEERLSLSVTKLETQAHIGPIIYMAKVFNMSTDSVTNYLILLLIFVFDPLAVAMTVHVNMLAKLRALRLNVESEAVLDDIGDIIVPEIVQHQPTDDMLSSMRAYDTKLTDMQDNIATIAKTLQTLQQPLPDPVDRQRELLNKLRS